MSRCLINETAVKFATARCGGEGGISFLFFFWGGGVHEYMRICFYSRSVTHALICLSSSSNGLDIRFAFPDRLDPKDRREQRSRGMNQWIMSLRASAYYLLTGLFIVNVAGGRTWRLISRVRTTTHLTGPRLSAPAGKSCLDSWKAKRSEGNIPDRHGKSRRYSLRRHD